MAFNAANPFNTPSGQDPYQGAKNQAVQTAGNAQSQNMDAISRRFAAMGNLNSGAYVQAQTDANRGAQQDAQNQISNINVAEQQGAVPYAQIQSQEGMQGQQLGQQQGQYEQSLGEQQTEFNKNYQLAQNQQAMDSAANALNGSLSQWQQQHSGGLLGSGGFLGLGIGNGGMSGSNGFF